ncbi:sel1 repeat family protein [Dyella solisilvae]|uniref:Sel1 repeat family protein n=1 Tax=Dyella solisilvae TaxID=1920168 RepID=A0A370K327_9GAMM|nr:tetratricopeptide repeat protein [Dyella solisilvae]RDI97066.1 sel1 repeat family protein [Dyella solisilvae]
MSGTHGATRTDELLHLLRTSPARVHTTLLAQALAGDAASQLAVAQTFLEGIGCQRDMAEALYWFQLAAHQGEPMAMNMIGRIHQNGWGVPVNVELAAVWYRESAEHASDWGMYNYACLLAHGRGVLQNRKEAFHWFRCAAEAGHARAMHFLGQYYEYGWETEPDSEAARELYRRSAEKGDYRGKCSWASVLTEEGRIEEACALLRSAIAVAPDHFAEALRSDLLQSQHPQLRALAAGSL